MKFIPEAGSYGVPTLELTRRNLEVLLEKLDMENSRRTIIDPDHKIAVKAVENEEHYGHRRPGMMILSTGADFGDPPQSDLN